MILKNRYDRSDYISFFRDKLLPEDFVSRIEETEIGFKSKYYQAVTFLGECPSLDLNIYEIHHSSEYDARIGLSRDAFKLVSRFDKNNALIFFIPQNSANYRLSLVTIEPKLDESGARLKYEYSNPKRYSFYLGEDAKTHTPEQYLSNLGRISDIDDLKRRFSVEVVNKEFYSQIAALFSRLVGGKRKQGSKIETFEHELELPSISYSGYEQKYKEFAVRLIGRTVFCWFLKKKKSSNEIPLIPDDVLSKNVVDSSSNFYHSVIEPLFFQILNTPIAERKKDFRTTVFDTIPFLNGGLFEPQTEDYFNNNQPNYALKIPDDWFKSFIEVLDTYNFTIDENTSIDIDLSVDPEMLGRIFENLLAEINPETGDTARKATGSYYTPRPIVEYMVNESLKQYLSTKTNIEESKLDALLDYSNEQSGLSNEEEQAVIKAFDTIKILDPACGSGAFPMGMLQKMLLVLQKVDHEAKNSIQKILDEIPDPVKRKLVEAKLKVANLDDLEDYARKLSIIQRSIYGVDIQPIAADISKLRFFLSLIVDEAVKDEKLNRGIEPLPNLEFKFVCANTLIPLPNDEMTGGGLFEDRTNIEKLEKIREDFFISYGDEKDKLKDEFKKVQKDMLQHSLNIAGGTNNATNSRTFILSAWNPFENETTNWFDSKWMFGVDVGFNIVIGNPPYVPLPKIDPKLKKTFSSLYKCATGRFNLFYLFIEKAFKECGISGEVCIIVPDRLLLNTQLKELRNWLLENNMVNQIVSFNEGVFDNAVVDNVIISFKPIKVQKDYSVKIFNKTDINKLENRVFDLIPIELFKNSYNKQFNLDYDPKKEELFTKIRNNSIPLNEISDIRDGIIQSKVGKELFIDRELDSDSRRLLFGRDIGRYSLNYDNHWVNYKIDLMKKLEGERNDGVINLRMRNPSVFERPKILTRQTADKIIAAFDNSNFYYANTLHGTHITSDKYSYEFVLAVLNSKLISWYYQSNTDEKGKVFAQIKIELLSRLPIPYAEKNIQNKITSIVNQIVTLKIKSQADNTEKLINLIDILVFKLFNLSFQESLIIFPELNKIIEQDTYENKTITELTNYEINDI